MLIAASEKRTGEQNRSLCLTEAGGMVVGQGSVQQHGLCVPERERHGEKGLEKGQEKLHAFCLHNTGEKLHGRLPAD